MWVERYAEKLNGLPADQLDAAWAAEWLGDVNVLQVIRELVQGSSHTRHLPKESFRYPMDGASEVYVQLAEMVRHHGGEIRLSSPLQEIRTADGRVVGVVAGGEWIDCAALVATVPVQVLYRCLKTGPPPEVGAALAQLRFRSALLVYVEVETSAARGEAFIYVHDEDVPFSRVTNYAAFQRSPDRKTTVLCVEHWVEPEALPEGSDDQVVHRAIRGLERCGIVEPGTAALTSRVVRLGSALPIYRLGNRERVRQAADWLRGWQGMELAGRAASFRNLGQSQAMAEGAESARRLLRTAGLAAH
jgi:protoporphyrinogen oxidase